MRQMPYNNELEKNSVNNESHMDMNTALYSLPESENDGVLIGLSEQDWGLRCE